MRVLSENPVAAGGHRSASIPPQGDGLQSVDPVGVPDWDELCQSFTHANFFHGIAWRRVLGETYRARPSYLVAESRSGKAIFPFFEVRRFHGARRGVSLPFSDFCEPLLAPDAPARSLWENLVQEARARSWAFLELRGGRTLCDGAGPSLSFYGHELELERQEAKVFRRLSPPVRRAIRKGEREGVQVSVTRSLGGVEDYYRLHCRTRKRHGLPPQPFRLFAKIHEHALSRGAGFVVLARSGGRAVAGGVFLQFGEKALFKFGASDWRCQHLRANNLVMWGAIQELVRAGSSTLHFGRTSKSNEGLRRFKLGWGVKEEELNYYRYDLGRSTFIQDRDRVTGWYNGLFRRMPVGLARLIGALLYGQFA